MTNLSNQDTNNNDDFAIGDVVVLNTPLEFIDRNFDSDELFIVQDICGLQSGGITILINGERVMAADSELRHATTAEKIAKRRLPAPVALFISPQVESVQLHSPDKLAILDMGEVNNISCHISPLCQVLNKSYMTDVIKHLVRVHKAQQEVS